MCMFKVYQAPPVLDLLYDGQHHGNRHSNRTIRFLETHFFGDNVGNKNIIQMYNGLSEFRK